MTTSLIRLGLSLLLTVRFRRWLLKVGEEGEWRTERSGRLKEANADKIVECLHSPIMRDRRRMHDLDNELA